MRPYLDARREWEAANHWISRQRWWQYQQDKRIRGLRRVGGVLMVPAGPLVIIPSKRGNGQRGPDKGPRKKKHKAP